ncbi:MAG TPA: iron ABC transporter permease, partial [Nevskiaceae bacterium]|nr:iron ABC transporter permease [Nevskiaceae bacterium]
MSALLSPRRSIAGICFTLAAATLAAACLALMQGPLHIAPTQVWHSLWHAPDDSLESATVLLVRLPRVLLALVIGAALAQAGASMQAIFRNPLADPGLAGVSSGAALGAALVIVLAHRADAGDGTLVRWLLPAAAFAGGAGTAWLVSRLAQVDGTTRVGTMLLAGLAINAIAGAGLGFLSHIASDTSLHTLSFWMFGSLAKSGWNEIALLAPLLLAATLLIPRDARALDALLLGEVEAGHLGIDVERLKRRQLVLIVFCASASAALGGIIGFVGLLVPHLVRRWAGPDHRLLLPVSALGGALLLLLADTAARVLLAPAELPIGIFTALLGGPF